MSCQQNSCSWTLPHGRAWVLSCVNILFPFPFFILFRKRKTNQHTTWMSKFCCQCHPPFLPSFLADAQQQESEGELQQTEDISVHSWLCVWYIYFRTLVKAGGNEKKRQRKRGGGGKGRHQPEGSKLFFRWTVRDKETPLTVTATKWPRRHPVPHTLLRIAFREQ